MPSSSSIELLFTFALFTLSPFLIRFGSTFGAVETAVLGVAIFLGIVAYLRISIYRWRAPLAFDTARLIGFSSWTYYPGAMLWLELSGVGRKYLLVVALVWLVSELISFTKLKAISDSQLTKAFSASFSTDADGNILYDATKERSLEILSADSRSRLLEVFEVLPTVVVFILGPYLYINSFMLRTDFQPRFLICCAFAFAFATLTRMITMEYRIVRRALRLKAKAPAA